jgi:putative transposase
VQQVCEVSERRACQTLGVARSTFRYESVAPDDHELIALLRALRVEFDTWGYRKLTGVLKTRGHQVNHKRVHRIWKAQGWQRPRLKKKQDKPRGDKTNACHIRAAEMGNHAWAVDFVTDHTHEGKVLKILTVLDEYTCEALAVEVRRSMGQKDVRDVLMRLFMKRGVPEFVRSDNGGEFAGELISQSLKKCGSEVALIAPGSPWQNGKNERFNGILSQELLSREVWGNLKEAQVLCEQWRQRYNEVRPHGSLGMATPSDYAEQVRQDGRWRLIQSVE